VKQQYYYNGLQTILGNGFKLQFVW